MNHCQMWQAFLKEWFFGCSGLLVIIVKEMDCCVLINTRQHIFYNSKTQKMLTSLTDKSNKYLRHILSGLENIFYTLLMFSISTCKLTKYAPQFNTGLILIERIANDKDQIQ